jgi:hypothetical protein
VSILRRLAWAFPLVLFLTISARADSAQVYFDGSYAFGNNGYGIGPYGGTLNDAKALFYCVDFNHDIVGNSGWSATVSNLGTSSLSGTLLNSAYTYSEMAWLITQMYGTTNQTLQADYQWAVWSLSVGSNPNAPNNPDSLNAQLIGNAADAVNHGWSANGWEILTPLYGTGGYNHPGYYGQEFMVHPAPEPSSLLLLLGAFAALAFFARRNSGLTASHM